MKNKNLIFIIIGLSTLSAFIATLMIYLFNKESTIALIALIIVAVAVVVAWISIIILILSDNKKQRLK